MDYALPRADDLPPFDIELVERPTAANPLGVEGLGAGGLHRRAADRDGRHPRCAAAGRRRGARHAGDTRTRLARAARGRAPLIDKPSGGQHHVLTGILFICGAGILFPVMNGFAKFLGESGYDSLQVSWARAFGHILFMLAAFVPRFGLGMLRTHRLGTQILRSALLMTSNLSFFFAIITIPIAKAASISLTAPLVVALLAWPMLGERTTVGRLVALGVGFVGRADRDPARHRALPVGIARRGAERHLLCALPDPDAAHRRQRTRPRRRRSTARSSAPSA